MKNLFYKILLTTVIGLGISSVPMVSEAYQCQWQNGHKVCWHNGTRNCRWVNGHWHNGYYYRGHKVCWIHN